MMRRLQVLLLLAVCFPSYAANAEAAAVAELQARIAELETRLAERDATIAELRAELASLRGRDVQLDRREADLETLAGVITTAELAERYDSRVTVREQGGRRVVTAGPQKIENESLVGDLFLSAVYSAAVDAPQAVPDSISVFVQGKFTAGQFSGVDHLTFRLNGEELSIPVADYELIRKRSGLPGKRTANKSDEALELRVKPATLRRVAEATTVEMLTPKGVVVWEREQRALLRALLARMDKSVADTPTP
jgi:uncharacterized coiled-coil protein SlyX